MLDQDECPSNIHSSCSSEMITHAAVKSHFCPMPSYAVPQWEPSYSQSLCRASIPSEAKLHAKQVEQRGLPRDPLA